MKAAIFESGKLKELIESPIKDNKSELIQWMNSVLVNMQLKYFMNATILFNINNNDDEWYTLDELVKKGVVVLK